MGRSGIQHGCRLAALAGATIAVAVLAGCGGGGAKKAAGPPPPAAANAAEFGLPEAEIVRRQIKVEAQIQTCMKKQGFDYVPVDPATLQAAMQSNSKPTGVSEAEFRKQYGYGISTLYDAQLRQAQASQGEPNKKIRAALAPADQAAYDRALYGDNASATFAAALDSEDLSGLGGCTKQAVDVNFPAAELKLLRANGQNAIGDRALQDPRVIDATKTWSTCMRAAGYTYATPDDIGSDLKGKLAAIVGAAPRTVPIGTDPAKAVRYDAAAMADLKRQELAVAAADFACAAKGLAATTTKVEAEITKSLGG